MNSKPLWKVSAVTTPEAEEAVAELFERTFGQPAISYTDLESGRTTVTVYLRKKVAFPARLSPPEKRSLLSELERIKHCGLNIGLGAISFKKVRREDWAESWKRHFKPIAIGSKLLIKPSWSRRRPRKGQSVVVLDPGLSFGTGQHPTTGFCLRQLAARRKPAARQSFLDIGTGSGILAIAAAKLGYEPVEAFDFDAEAVRIARENAAKNQVSAGIRLRRQDVTKLPLRSAGKYSVICANLIANLLLSERGRLLARLPEDGVLVLAGILKTEFRQVQRAFESAGLRLVASRTEHEWRSGAFIWHRA
jgi:ribosomal protein L11 methyltransferase